MDEDPVAAPPNALLECLAEGMARGKRHKYEKSGPLGPYIQAARWIPAGIDPFIDPRVMLYEGMTAEFRHAEEPLRETDSERIARLRNIEAFEKFKNILPGFSATINGFEDKPDVMDEFVTIITDHARNARSEDVYKVRTRGIRHILGDDFESHHFNPPLDPYGDKIQRGWNHPQTARALCPMQSLAEFDEDPTTFMDRVKDGSIKIKSSQFPAFIYSSAIQYDPSNRRRGLLRGEVLLRNFRLLFTGASSAATGVSPKSTKRCKAAIHGLREPTPETIAYAAVLDRFSLSSVESWSNADGLFKMDQFWRYLVKLFDPEDGMDPQWIEDTMAWWKAQNPALKNLPSVEDDYNSEDDEENDFTVLRRQRLNGHGQEAANDEDDVYAHHEPIGLATPVVQQRARDSQISPHQVQVDVTSPRPRALPSAPRSHIALSYTQSQPPIQYHPHSHPLALLRVSSLPTVPSQPHRSQATPGPSQPHRSQATPRPSRARDSYIDPPHTQNPLVAPYRGNEPQSIQHRDRGHAPAMSLGPPGILPHAHYSNTALPRTQNPQVADHHGHGPQSMHRAPAMALGRAYSPNGTRNRDDTPSPTSHAHQGMDRSPQGPLGLGRTAVAQPPPSRAPTDQHLQVSPSLAEVPDLIRLHAAANLLNLRTATRTAAARDTTRVNLDPALQGDREPLRPTQPGGRAQVLDHPPITIQNNKKRKQAQAIDESDEEIDELAEFEESDGTTVTPAKKVPQSRKKRVVPPGAQIENIEPPEPTQRPLTQSPPKNTRGQNTRGTKARRSKRGK